MSVYPVTYDETTIADAAARISTLWDDIGNIEPERLGACRFCGQVQNVATAPFIFGADIHEQAARRCDCAEAKRYKERIFAEAKKKQDREIALERAAETIDEMFGDDAVGFGKIPVKEEIRGLMLDTAALIYDRKLKDAAINITSCVKVKISKSSKDKLTFQRSDMAVSKQEVDE